MENQGKKWSNVAIETTSEYLVIVVRVQSFPQPEVRLNLFKQCRLSDENCFLCAKIERSIFSGDSQVQVEHKQSKTQNDNMKSGSIDSIGELVKDLQTFGAELYHEGKYLKDIHNFFSEAAASYSQQEELQRLHNYLQKGLEAVLESKMNYFYSIPPQSVIHIGSSTYKGINNDVKISEYPLLIADLRAATNYFIIRTEGGDLEHITQSPLGEESFSHLARLLAAGDGSVS